MVHWARSPKGAAAEGVAGIGIAASSGLEQDRYHRHQPEGRRVSKLATPDLRVAQSLSMPFLSAALGRLVSCCRIAPRLALSRAGSCSQCSPQSCCRPQPPSALCRSAAAGPRGPPAGDVALGRSLAGAPHPQPSIQSRPAAIGPSSFPWTRRSSVPFSWHGRSQATPRATSSRR